VFSSTAALYGVPEVLPINENARIQPANPYGHTKAAVEQMLADLSGSEDGWRIARLRYFNPVGAHPSGRIGEDPNGIPSNLFPLITQAAMGIQPYVQVYGSDWETPDGTGIRDFIHVMDLAEGHKMALEALLAGKDQIMTLNLGSGHGHSVLEMIHAFERINACRVPYRFAPRRPGDVATSVADPSGARNRLGWTTKRSLEDICRDGWAWRKQNRDGYAS
jgi:UDP-glucose 4-epimerase